MKQKIYDKYLSLCSNYKIEPKNQILSYLKDSKKNENEVNIIFPGNTSENYNNRIALEDLHPLISSLITFGNHVRYVDLSFNRLGQKSGIYFEKLFEHSPNVVSIKLKGNNIDDIACSLLVKVLLEKNNCIEELDLNTNCIGNIGIMEVTKLIFKKSTLVYLDIGHNYYDWDGLIAVNYALKPSVKKIKVKLDNPSSGGGLGNFEGFNEINSNVRSQSLKKIENDESKYTYLPRLRVLNIDDPQYRDNDQDFFTHFGKMLLCNTNLQKLSLRFHKLRFEGCKILFHHLESNISLQVLDLSNNQICFQGITFISSYLSEGPDKKDKKHPPNLISLNLSGNHIHNQGAIILSEGLATNSSLVYLNLSNNSIKNDGLYKLAGGLSDNKTIQYLKIFTGNYWGSSAISIFNELIQVKERFNPDFEIYEPNQEDLQICYKDDVTEEELEYTIK